MLDLTFREPEQEFDTNRALAYTIHEVINRD